MHLRHHSVRVGLFAFLGAALILSAAASSLRAAGPAQQENRRDVLILFKSQPNSSDHDQVRGMGGRITHSYHLVPGMAANLPESAIAALERNPRVASVEPDGEVFAIADSYDWGVARTGAPTIHAGGNKGAGVIVAVIDSGVDCTHPDLAANCIPGGYDFVNDDSDPADDNSHGTHVAGTIAAADNNAGLAGVAPRASLLPIKVLNAQGSGSFSDVIAALQLAVDRGAQVTNNSYGSAGDPGIAVQTAFNNAEAAGVLNVAAAGNSGRCSGGGNNIGYPARYASVMAVTATDANNVRPCFSSTGDDAEIAAPGVGITSTIPGGGYASYSGTSMASPHVVGVAALVLASGVVDANANGRVNDEVRGILTSTAHDLGAAGRDPLYGFGLVDAVAAVNAEPPPAASTMSVSSISYATSGGRGGTKNLQVTVNVVDDLGGPVGGASVSVTVQRDGQPVGSSTGTTGTNGVVTFTLTNAAAGTYVTTVTNVAKAGLTWDGVTPSNSYVKN